MTNLDLLRDYFQNFLPSMHSNGYTPRDEDEQGWHRGAQYVCTQALAFIEQLGGDESEHPVSRGR